MIEFTSNHHGIRAIEKACKALVSKGAGQCIKNTRLEEEEFKTERYINNPDKKEELKGRRPFGTVVYRQYLLKVGSGLIFRPHVADIRFWYNERNNIAGIKVSEDTLIAIMQTTTIANLLHSLDVSLGGGKDGKMTLDKVAMLLTKTMVKIAPNAQAIFSAQKK